VRWSLAVLSLAACSSSAVSSADLAVRDLALRGDMAGRDCLPITPSTMLYQGHCPEATPCFREFQTPGY
jgi:hypothetical protein